MLTEQTVVSQVTFLPLNNCVNVQWSIRILKDGQIVAERYHRKTYASGQSAAFASEVENAAVYMQALGWTVDG